MEGGDGRVKWSEVQMMKCTWRVAQELLRLPPPIFRNFRTIMMEATHMNEKIFEKPEKFNPSRFEGAKISVPPYTYVPFGADPRTCPGAEFARTGHILILPMVTKYERELMIPDEPITREPMPYPVMGLPVKLLPRKLG